ncbi:MAG: 1-(5-phosphoribosyl)-5-[(5-phosphoribosylamino)methylideneamino]imidazole-4-carboxamide isomerase [Bacteroidota bacterium]
MRIIPAIDLSEGKVVRLRQGDYAQKTQYFEDPLVAARQFAAAGLRYLHVVDLDGAKARRIVNLPVLRRLVQETDLVIDFGGGIASKADLEAALEAGAAQVTVGSLAAREPERFLAWLEEFGPEQLILGADARAGKIAVAGWQEATEWEVSEFVHRMGAAGVRYVVCTDIARDGMLAGPALDLYRQLLRENPELKLVASGGIRGADDLQELAAAGLDGAIVGRAIYESGLEVLDLKND